MHIAIVGGGLVGLGTARALREARPDASITVIEKEDRLGAHQSTHNSGVLHAGLYYKPGSSKARLAVEGIRLMRKFCEEHDVAHETCGKLVVATTEDEVPRLRALEERGRANGLTGIARLGPAAAREREPSVRAVEALVVPEEGIVDYAGVVNALERSLRASGVAFLLRSEVRTIDRRGGAWRIEGSDFATEADLLVTCAGLQSAQVTGKLRYAGYVLSAVCLLYSPLILRDSIQMNVSTQTRCAIEEITKKIIFQFYQKLLLHNIIHFLLYIILYTA